MGRDGNLYQAPSDEAEFWKQDYEYVRGLTRKILTGAGVSLDDADDAASEIFERLMVSRNKDGQNILGQYSADFTSARNGKNVTWRGFLGGKVALYCRGKRESILRRTGRELLLCDTAAGDGTYRWVELFGGERWDDYPSLSDVEFTDRMRDYLATVPDTWDGPGSLFTIFNEIIESIKRGERPQATGLNRAETLRAVREVRRIIREGVSQPPPGTVSVVGVELTPGEVRDALDRLRAAKGNHVHRALAGHRLMTEGARGWYHAFAQAELAMYPDLAIGQRQGKVGGAGAPHVKEAVMHGLSRLLTGAPEPEPDAEPSREEEFESRLWRIPGMDAAKVDAIVAAAQQVYA